MMKDNKLRRLLNEKHPSVATRIWTTQPFFTECLGASGNFDYMEFVAEYTPFDQRDLETLAMAAELHNMGSMIKIDFQNRGYVAQKAVAAGFQAVLFTDCRNADEVRESITMVKPETAQDGGSFGYPIRRFIGYQPRIPQLDHAARLRDVVIAFMVEKHMAMENIEAICAVPGVDMLQFGGSDYSLSRGWNAKDHPDEVKEAQKKMIEVALKHGVQPRCEIQSVNDAQYYIGLGVRHFCLGDQFVQMQTFWSQEGGAMRKVADSLKE
ncbi:2,4-dihydroxyhept-2-ene-1,7-dioic acid aldolase [uncultured delta proteobacterium]|uniref:2,4-dihydroxyhept-2-ene-1,7-dioic acid aldolase n=1 Tax=uncultured delta proteobacterium TaxID=34034 RepID=A0A212K9Y1_9DELT|nr:2,4-dihydroxyhept-2-ene-1,7-dioic acid aldolase [uncultured delta proteobacterium]